MTQRAFLIALLPSIAILAGCIGGSGGQRGPDEFRVIKKAPLVIPPDYSLRPPTPGQSTPVEVSGDRSGTTAFGLSIGADASEVEKRFVADAGATAVSQVIRSQIDYEEARTIRKSSSASERLLQYEDTGEPVEDSATGGAEVTIERTPGDRLKLPGT